MTITTRSGATVGERSPSKDSKDSSKSEEAERRRKSLEERPVRPSGLRTELMRLYVVLVVINLAFVAFSVSMQHEVPKGMFEKADGSLIALEKYDPKELGPFPKCHEHYGEHWNEKDGKWVKNDELEEGDDFEYPVGHPKNKAWKEKREAQESESKLTFQALQPSIHLLLVSVTVVYLGCRHAVWLFAKPSDADKKDDTEKDEDVGQSALQDGDAYMFPIMGSAVLFGLFIVYKYLDSDWIKYLFSVYVVVMCTNGLGINIGQFVAVMYNSRGLSKFKTLFTIPYLDVQVTVIDIAAYMVSCALGVYYIQTKNWIVNNLMGLSFCLLGLKHIGISSYKTGAIMLCGLFVYDIFWVFGSKSVFGSNVMVTVATGVEAPIKLMFPRSQDGCGNMMFSMLGLGDIVVPGIVLAFIAKFDAHRKNSSTTYLDITMVGYALSLISTVVVMLVFNHAQPALLYIVPFVLIASFSAALIKGQTKELLDFVVEDTMIALEEPAADDKKDK